MRLRAPDQRNENQELAHCRAMYHPACAVRVWMF
jgi:hypothetical protein